MAQRCPPADLAAAREPPVRELAAGVTSRSRAWRSRAQDDRVIRAELRVAREFDAHARLGSSSARRRDGARAKCSRGLACDRRCGRATRWLSRSTRGHAVAVGDRHRDRPAVALIAPTRRDAVVVHLSHALVDPARGAPASPAGCARCRSRRRATARVLAGRVRRTRRSRSSRRWSTRRARRSRAHDPAARLRARRLREDRSRGRSTTAAGFSRAGRDRRHRRPGAVAASTDRPPRRPRERDAICGARGARASSSASTDVRARSSRERHGSLWRCSTACSPAIRSRLVPPTRAGAERRDDHRLLPSRLRGADRRARHADPQVRARRRRPAPRRRRPARRARAGHRRGSAARPHAASTSTPIATGEPRALAESQKFPWSPELYPSRAA